MSIEKPKRKLPNESRPGDSHTADFREYKLDIYKLIYLSESLEAESINPNDLADAKSGNYWKDKNNNWINLGQLLEEIDKYDGKPNWDEIIQKYPEWEEEIEKIKIADYNSHPILIVEGVVVDGMHRLTKAWAEKANEIKVKRFPKLPEEAIMRNNE